MYKPMGMAKIASELESMYKQIAIAKNVSELESIQTKIWEWRRTGQNLIYVQTNGNGEDRVGT